MYVIVTEHANGYVCAYVYVGARACSYDACVCMYVGVRTCACVHVHVCMRVRVWLLIKTTPAYDHNKKEHGHDNI